MARLLDKITLFNEIGRETLFLCGNEFLIKSMAEALITFVGLNCNLSYALQVYLYTMILLIIGISCLISPITYNFTYNTQIGVLLFATILLSLFSVIPPKNEMSRLNGVLYLIIYIIYTVFLFIT